MNNNSGAHAKRVEPLRLIQQKLELVSIDDIDAIPKGLRDIYVLYRTAASERVRTPHRHVVMWACRPAV